MHPYNDHTQETPRQLSERLVREALTGQPAPHAMREIEQSLAYQQACCLIESSCVTRGSDGLMYYYDLDEVDPLIVNCDEEAAYLDSRGLLDHHSEHPRWASIRDESEATA